jgi:Phospholipid methyltransferase
MAETVDRPNVVIPPPIPWALAILAGLVAGWLYPLQFVSTSIPRASVSGGLFALGVALAVWAIVTIRKAGTQFDVHKPTTAIVENGPYRFTRNPVYLGMFLGQTGIAIGFDNLWVLAMLVPDYRALGNLPQVMEQPSLGVGSKASPPGLSRSAWVTARARDRWRSPCVATRGRSGWRRSWRA